MKAVLGKWVKGLKSKTEGPEEKLVLTFDLRLLAKATERSLYA